MEREAACSEAATGSTTGRDVVTALMHNVLHSGALQPISIPQIDIVTQNNCLHYSGFK